MECIKYYLKCMKSVYLTGTKTKKMKLEFFVTQKRAVDIFISLPLIWIWSLYIDQNGKFKECLVPKYILQSMSTNLSHYITLLFLFPKIKVMTWPMWRSAIFQTCLYTTTVYSESFIIVGAYFRGLWVFCFFMGIYFLGCVSSQFQ